MTTDTSNATSRLPLTTTQIAILVGIGAALWLAAALMLRALAPMGVYDGLGRVALYVLTVPGTYPFILIARAAARLKADQIAIAVTVATATAVLLDGIALAWFPALYGSAAGQVAGAGAAILWGAGVALVLGLAMNRSSNP